MVSRRLYDLIYRHGAPWESGPRSELVHLVASGRLSPSSLPTAIDLGCGSGANSVFLAQHGFQTVGVDFSPVALAKANALAAAAGVGDRCRFVEADLTADVALSGPFDLVVDFGTLDDLRGRNRNAMARLIHELSRPGSCVLLWCFYADPDDLPWMSFSGPSRLFPGLIPGEEHERFGRHFIIERLDHPPGGGQAACFLMIRKHE